MSKTKLWFTFTIIMGLITTMLITNYLKGLEETIAKETLTKVVVASVKIPQGTRINGDMIKTLDVPKNAFKGNIITNPNKAIGQFTTVDIWPEEIVIMDKLTSEDTSDELLYRIPKGTRAITVAVDAVSGVAGLIKTGHYIDVLLPYKYYADKADAKDPRAVTLLQNIKVLAVDANLTENQGEDAKETKIAENVTLAVTPYEAELITLAENVSEAKGDVKVKLVLRPVEDKQKTVIKAVDRNVLNSLYP